MDLQTQLLIKAFKTWLNKKGIEILPQEDEKLIRFKDGGKEHSIMFTDMDGKHGALAATSPLAAEHIKTFMEEVMGDKYGHSMHSIPASGKEEAEEMLKGLLEAGPEAAREFVEKEVGQHPLVNKMKLLHKVAKNAAEKSGDPEKIAEVEKLSKIIEQIDTIEEIMNRGASKDPEKTTNENEYDRLDEAGKVKKISKVKRLYVGQKFFDESKNLCIAVGFERGKKVTGEYVNSVIMIPNEESDEFFAGMPIKRELEELIRVVDI